MRRQVIEAGSYCEAHPNGSYAVLVGHNVIVNGAAKPNPFGSDYPMYLRSTPSGEFAGQGHDSGRVLRYVQSGWLAEGTTCGVNPVCYAPDGSLVVNDHCQYGTQGIRWIDPDGTIHTGDQTYDGRGSTGVAEYTRHGNVLVGQSYVDGCTIRATGDIPRTLEDGHCTFVRFNRSGDTCAVALWKQQEHCAVLFWFDVSEIASLAPEPTAPNPDPDPDPDPPDPDPEPPTMDITPEALAHLLRDQRSVIEGVKRDYPELVGDEVTDQGIHRLNRANGTDRYGRKARNSDGSNPNEDVVTIRLVDADKSRKKLIDVLIDGGGADTPTWDVRPANEEPGNGFWTPAVHPDRDGVTPPPPPDGDVSQAIKDYVDAVVTSEVSVPLQLLKEMDRSLRRLIAEKDEWAGEHIMALRQRVDKLENPENPGEPGTEPTIPKDVVRVGDFVVPPGAPPGTKPKRRVRVPLTFSSPLTGTIEDVK